MEKDIAIKVENLTKLYPLRSSKRDKEGKEITYHTALENINFEVKKGESVGIVGPNGSGKSTLLKILAGVSKPTTGQVKIRGKVASILDIGAGFHPELSGRENVYLNGQIHGFSRKEISKQFDAIVAFSGIEDFIDEPVKNYSNGMYLRLAFSIMAHLDFDIYLFDEVLSVGDAEFREKITNNFRNLKNKTHLYVYHGYQSVFDFDKKIILNKDDLNNDYYEEVKTNEILYVKTFNHIEIIDKSMEIKIKECLNQNLDLQLKFVIKEVLEEDVLLGLSIINQDGIIISDFHLGKVREYIDFVVNLSQLRQGNYKMKLIVYFNGMVLYNNEILKFKTIGNLALNEYFVYSNALTSISNKLKFGK